MSELELAERVESYALANMGPSSPVGQALMREVVAALRRVAEPVGEDRVERVAKAMCPTIFEKGSVEPGPATLAERDKLRSYARAAIAAICT